MVALYCAIEDAGVPSPRLLLLLGKSLSNHGSNVLYERDRGGEGKWRVKIMNRNKTVSDLSIYIYT